MYYVYSENVNNGRQDFVRVFDTKKEAVHWCSFCYQQDKPYNEDEYYYFIKQH